jgi:hypothetical protein
MKMNTENRVASVGAGGTAWGPALIMTGVIALSACGGLNATSDGAPSGKVDASAIDSANAIDGPAKTVCDPLAPFGPWVSLGDFQNGLSDAIGHPSADELEFYFSATVQGATDNNMYLSRRATVRDSFGVASLLDAQNSGGFDANPFIAADGLSLWFESDRGGKLAIYVATRTSLLADFGSPVRSMDINSVSSNTAQPFLLADNSEVYFTSDRAGGLGQYDIWHARKAPTSGFLPPELAPGLNSDKNDYVPTISADGLTMYLYSQRSSQQFDVFRTQRTTVNDRFSTLTPVPELNVGTDHSVVWISRDNCRVYGRHQGIASVATRQP